MAFGERSGTYVVDMSDASRPAITGTFNTPANQSPHESLSLPGSILQKLAPGAKF